MIRRYSRHERGFIVCHSDCDSSVTLGAVKHFADISRLAGLGNADYKAVLHVKASVICGYHRRRCHAYRYSAVSLYKIFTKYASMVGSAPGGYNNRFWFFYT
jgi:hypothetical protein